MGYVIGVDGGGSKTVCILLDAEGVLVGRGESGCANYQSVGIDAALQAIFTAIEGAFRCLGVGLENIQIDGICLGLAGVGRQQDVDFVRQKLIDCWQNSLFASVCLPCSLSTQLLITHDALISLVGGIGDGIGIVVAVGTGAIAFGRNAKGETKRVGGWGYLIGDEGSAYQIAIAGLQAVMRSFDGRGSATYLTEVFQTYFHLSCIEDLIPLVYRQGWGVKEIASLAPIIDSVAVQGDMVANQIIKTAVDELVLATTTVINSLFLPTDNFQVVTTGSVWQGQSQLRQSYISQLCLNYPHIQVIYPRFEPAYGAALLAFKQV